MRFHFILFRETLLWRRQWKSAKFMMTSSNRNTFHVTGRLCGEFTGHRWIPLTMAGQWHEALMFSLICAWTNDWVNNRDAGDLRRHRAHYDVIVMLWSLAGWYTNTSVACITAITGVMPEKDWGIDIVLTACLWYSRAPRLANSFEVIFTTSNHG